MPHQPTCHGYPRVSHLEKARRGERGHMAEGQESPLPAPFVLQASVQRESLL